MTKAQIDKILSEYIKKATAQMEKDARRINRGFERGIKEDPTKLTIDEQIKAPYLLDRELLEDFRKTVAKFRKDSTMRKAFMIKISDVEVFNAFVKDKDIIEVTCMPNSGDDIYAIIYWNESA